MKLTKKAVARIDNLLHQLHQAAIDVNRYELGLPLWDAEKQRLREIIAKWEKESKE